MFRIILFLLFFLSGFTGLVYEVVWTRIFGLIFGNTTLAISTVLSAFMLGLALGSLLLGRVADRVSNPLKIYGLLELGVGVFALLVPLLHGGLEMLFSIFYAPLQNLPYLFYLIKFLAAFLVMMPATLLMGGTLPMLSRVVVRTQKQLGLDVGSLYSINTFGAVLGTLFTAFLFIRFLGVNQSIYLTILVNIFLGICAVLLARGRETARGISSKSAGLFSAGYREVRLVLAVIAVSGFTALSYEVLWSRILVFLLTNSVYAFSVMLAAFLVGIAAGSYAGGKISDRAGNLMKVFGGLQILIGSTALLAVFLLINLPDIHSHIVRFEPGSSWGYLNVMRFAEAFIIMFIPTFLMGAAFPVAARIAVPHLSKLGSGLGQIYFFNTVGGVFGSFLTGFVFISLLGSSVTTALMIVLNLLAGVWILLSRQSLGRKSFIAVAAGGVTVMILIASLAPPQLFRMTYGAVEKDYPLIDFREGVEGTVTVHQANLPMLRNKRIDVDGLNVAGTSFMLRTLQTLQGHLPLLIHPHPEKVLQIGFGTGQTSYSALRHPIKEFRVIEISQDVLDMARKHFSEINRDVLDSPRFHYTIMDGKNYVKYTPEKYDIIMNDANYAVATASASLFTRDHFENCRKKLKPGGILSTWMTTDLAPEDFRIVLQTFRSVFPHTLLWMAPNCINKQVVLMGSDTPFKLDYGRLNAAFSRESVQRNLSRININSVYDLLDCLVLDSRGIESISQGAQENSDNHPVLEYSSRAIRSRDLCAYQNLAAIALRRPDVEALLANLPEKEAERKQVLKSIERHEMATRNLLAGMMRFSQGDMQGALDKLMEGSRIIPESRLAARYFKDLDLITAQLDYQARTHPQDVEARLRVIRQRIARNDFENALEKLKKLPVTDGNRPLIEYEKGRCYLALARYDSAETSFRKTLQQNSGMSAAWYFLGKVYRKKGQFEAAIESQQKAVRRDKRMYEACNEAGEVYRELKSWRKAINSYKQSLSILPYQPYVVAALGECYLNLKNYERASDYYRDAAALGYAPGQMFLNLGNTLYLRQKFAEAASFYLKAAELDSLNSEIYYNLGNSYVNREKWFAAVSAYEKAIRLNKNEPDYFNNLALCYRELGDYERALQVFKNGLKLHANSKLLSKNAEGLKDFLSAEKVR